MTLEGLLYVLSAVGFGLWLYWGLGLRISITTEKGRRRARPF
jgi:hypothetical protein